VKANKQVIYSPPAVAFGLFGGFFSFEESLYCHSLTASDRRVHKSLRHNKSFSDVGLSAKI